MDTHLIILILAIIGIAEALYLNYERRQNRAPVCVIGDECAIVWESPYSRTFGVSNEVWGIIFYAVVAVIESMIYWGDISSTVIAGEILMLIGGTIMSCYFTYLQWRVIRAWCFWCTLSAVIVWAMAATRIIFVS